MSRDSRSEGPAFCDTCGEQELDDHKAGEGETTCDVCWDKEVLGESYYDEGGEKECRECYGTGGLYDHGLGIDDRCGRCGGSGVIKKSSIRKVAANPRDVGNLWRPRTQEMTGGFNPREVLDLQINPNEDDDDLGHNSRNTTEDTESRAQADPEKRREKAMRELLPGLQHIQIKPEVMSDVIERSPRFEEENQLLETRLGVDLGARGLSFSAGAHRGSVRSDTPYVNYGRGTTNAFGKSEDLLKAAKDRFKSRKYEDDEDDEDDRKSNKRKKRSNKRPKKSKGKKKSSKKKSSKKKSRKKMQMPKRSASAQPPIGGGAQAQMPLKFRDPGQHNQQQSNRQMKNQGPPSGMSQGRGTKLPPTPNLGTNLQSALPGKKNERITDRQLGDPLGIEDPLKMLKSKGGLSGLNRTEIISLKKKIEALMRKLDKLAKAGVENEAKDKAGATPSKEIGSAPTGATKLDDGYEAWRFHDPTPLLVAGVVGKK